MKLILFVLLFLTLDIAASQERYALRGAYGKSTQSDYGEILSGQVEGSVAYSRVYALDGSYLVQKNLFELPLELYLSSGLAYFDEGVSHESVYEATLYLKLYYTLSLYRAKIRFGLGEGGSYTSNILHVEMLQAQSVNGNNSHFLNYLDTSVDINLGSLFATQELKHTVIGALIKHRSGIFGLINNVKKGGSNYNCLYIEQSF